MAIYNDIDGRFVSLKSCSIDDAEFTLSLRQNPSIARFIPMVDGNIDKQIKWIKSQRIEEGDYFFVVWDKSGKRIGTLGLYNIEEGTAEAGRLVMNGNSLQSLEAQILVFDFAFEVLKLKEVVSFIYFDNERALRFSSQFGGIAEEPKVYKENDRPMIKKHNTPETYYKARIKLLRYLYR